MTTDVPVAGTLGGRGRPGLLARPLRRARPAARARLAVLRRPALAALRLLDRVTAPLRWSGLTLLLVASICLAAGLDRGWDEVTLVGVACLACLVVAAGFAVGRSRYRVEVHLRDRRVVVGERALGRVVTTNDSRRRLLPARLELLVGRGRASFHLPALAAGDQHEDVFVVPTSRRAVVAVGPARSVRGDALGLVHRVVRWTDPQDLFVHPRTVVLEGAAPGFLRDLEGRPVPVLSNSDVSFHALREYVPGDDRRYVHWRTSARTGRLMVRQFEETRRSHVAVLLSTRADDYGDPHEFELAVSVCGSLAVQTLRDERDLSVLTSAQTLRIRSAPGILDDLCRVEPGGDAPDLVGLAHRSGREVPGASVVFLVCGGGAPTSLLGAAVRRLPLDARTVVVRCEQGAPLTVRALGSGADVVTTGSLDDLARGLRTAARS